MTRGGHRRGGVTLTRAGHLVVASSIGLAIVGWYLGLRELLLLGGVGLVLVGLCVARTAFTRPRLVVRRTLQPAYVHAGGVSRVTLEVTNPSDRHSPPAVLHDEVEGTAGATVEVGRLEAAASVSASYRLPTARRGRFTIGPLRSSLVDPFGLTQRTGVAVAPTALVVFPTVVPLAPVRRSAGQDAPEGLGRPRRLGHGDEFHGLRPYVPGDDLRSVHWPSSARADDLVVRQHSQERRGTVTLLVDLRRSIHDADTVEAAVSFAASLLLMLENQREAYRLVTTGGVHTGLGAGPRHLRACLEHLAIAGPDLASSVRAAAGGLGTADQGVLVVITAGSARAAGEAVAGLGFASAVAAVLRPSGSDAGGGRHPNVAVLPVPDHRAYASAWDAAMHAASTVPTR